MVYGALLQSLLITFYRGRDPSKRTNLSWSNPTFGLIDLSPYFVVNPFSDPPVLIRLLRPDMDTIYGGVNAAEPNRNKLNQTTEKESALSNYSYSIARELSLY